MRTLRPTSTAARKSAASGPSSESGIQSCSTRTSFAIAGIIPAVLPFALVPAGLKPSGALIASICWFSTAFHVSTERAAGHRSWAARQVRCLCQQSEFLPPVFRGDQGVLLDDAGQERQSARSGPCKPRVGPCALRARLPRPAPEPRRGRLPALHAEPGLVPAPSPPNSIRRWAHRWSIRFLRIAYSVTSDFGALVGPGHQGVTAAGPLGGAALSRS